MKSVINKHLQWFAAGFALTVFQLSGQVKVSFETAGQTVDETDTVYVTIKLSEPSLLEVEVPYVVASDSTAVLDEDFEIPEDDEDTDYDNASPIVFAPGETSKTFEIDMINDSDVEDDEFIYIDLAQDEAGVVELGDITRHTIRVLDNDEVRVYFKSHESEVYESSNISLPLYLSAPSDQDIEVSFSVTTLTASDDDIDMSSTYTTQSPLTISAGGTMSSVGIKVVNDSITDRNAGGADEETLEVVLQEAVLVDTGESIDFDTTPVLVTIVDNDPLTVEFSYSDDLEQPVEINEYTSTSVSIRLLNPDGYQSSASDDIDIPITYGGTAIRGDGDNDDYNTSDDTITITAGNSSATFSVAINNDDNIEEDESIEFTLGTPAYQDGGDLILGEKSTLSFLIKDNDPVTLSFGALYSKDDEAAAEDDTIDDILYVPVGGSTVAESAGTVSIPVYLSSPSANNVEFDLEIVGAGTTATMYDSNNDSTDQDWDYTVSSADITKTDKSVAMVIRAGVQVANITLTLNNDTETPVIYGQAPASDVESDETVQFRISNVNTDSSYASMGDFSTYDLVIKDLPDIDITDLVNGLSPDPAGLVNGNVRYNPATALFEADYHMSLNTVLDPNDFPGYNSIKARFRLSNYDAANPDAETNDPLVKSPQYPDDGEEFNFFVDTPFQVRFPNNALWIRLKEGVDPVDDYYDITTADTIEIAPYILKTIDFPRLNDFEASIKGAFDLNDPLDWCVDFYSPGRLTMPLDRIDPTVNPERLRIYLSTAGANVYSSSSGTSLSFDNFVPQPDGSMLMVINTNNNTSVQIQYLDAGDEWRIVQPTSIATGGASKLYWIDNGPPQTHTHPSNVNFRLYRATTQN